MLDIIGAFYYIIYNEENLTISCNQFPMKFNLPQRALSSFLRFLSERSWYNKWKYYLHTCLVNFTLELHTFQYLSVAFINSSENTVDQQTAVQLLWRLKAPAQSRHSLLLSHFWIPSDTGIWKTAWPSISRPFRCPKYFSFPGPFLWEIYLY